MECGSEVGMLTTRKQKTVHAAYEALVRLVRIAQEETGQAYRVADFLLSWHNASAHGGWNPTDLWSVDSEIAADMLAVLELVLTCRRYPDMIGFELEMDRLWRRWQVRQPRCIKVQCSVGPSIV